jgi:CubicO group peptidase (beta-lactamase class C family)
MVIEAASGLNFYEEALRRFVLPLGLTRTEPQTKRAFDQLASGYAGDGAEYGSLAPGAGKTSEDGVMKNHPGGEWTGGGWVSNPSDLAKWMRAMCAPQRRSNGCSSDRTSCWHTQKTKTARLPPDSGRTSSSS